LNVEDMIRVCSLFMKSISTILRIILAIIMPDDVAEEKVKALQALGAEVQRVRPASIVDKKQVRTSSEVLYL
jgi:cysteine synthase